MKQYGEFLNPSRYVPFSDRLRSFFWSVRPQLSEDITAYTERMVIYVRSQFAYDGATTNVHSTVDDILTSGGGVCQDFAHLSIGLLRLAGIPARYVSGYLAPDPQRAANSKPPELASHAWIEALLPGTGWTGFDPTHRTRTLIRHIRVAVGRDYNDLPPVSGVYESAGGARRMAYELEVSPADQHGSVDLKPIICDLRFDFLNAVQSFRQIDRIAHRDFAGIDLVCPYLEVGQPRRSIHRRKGALDRVETLRDLYSANSGFVVARIKDMPSAAKIHFAVGVKIHRRSGIHMSDVRQMTGDVSRRHVERAAQRDRAMSKVAAHTVASFDYLRG